MTKELSGFEMPTVDCQVVYDDKFGGSCVEITIEDFIKQGFEYGDSVDVAFASGFRMEDIPLYSGYYVPFGEPLLCGYKGYPTLFLTYNMVGGVFDRAGLDKNKKANARISLNEKGKYLNIQNLMSQTHSNDRNDYRTDEEFANYREITGSKTKEKLIYRSASTTSDMFNRVNIVDALDRKYNVQYIFDLEDSREEMERYASDDTAVKDYWKSLYSKGRILPINLPVNYMKQECAELCAYIIRFILNNEGPFMFHCTEGKDRTGFLGIVFGSLIGKPLEEIEKDYMLTYLNYYSIGKENTPEEYKAIKELYFDSYLKNICNQNDSGKINEKMLLECVEAYLIKGGLGIEEIEEFKKLYQ